MDSESKFYFEGRPGCKNDYSFEFTIERANRWLKKKINRFLLTISFSPPTASSPLITCGHDFLESAICGQKIIILLTTAAFREVNRIFQKERYPLVKSGAQ